MFSWIGQHQDLDGFADADMMDQETTVHRGDRYQPWQVVRHSAESPDMVLRETNTSVREIAIQRPIPMGDVHKPINFGVVVPGIYRSGYPATADYPYIQSLGLKTIVTLVAKEMPDGFQQFIDQNHITHKVFDMSGTKKADIAVEMMQSILAVITNRKNYPMLIHCNHGKHRTGCVVGVLRKVNQWDTESIVQEYTKYAAPKVRETDVSYLTDFKISSLVPKPESLPITVGRYSKMIIVAALTLCLFVYSLATIRRTPSPRKQLSIWNS